MNGMSDDDKTDTEEAVKRAVLDATNFSENDISHVSIDGPADVEGGSGATQVTVHFKPSTSVAEVKEAVEEINAAIANKVFAVDVTKGGKTFREAIVAPSSSASSADDIVQREENDKSGSAGIVVSVVAAAAVVLLLVGLLLSKRAGLEEGVVKSCPASPKGGSGAMENVRYQAGQNGAASLYAIGEADDFATVQAALYGVLPSPGRNTNDGTFTFSPGKSTRPNQRGTSSVHTAGSAVFDLNVGEMVRSPSTTLGNSLYSGGGSWFDMLQPDAEPTYSVAKNSTEKYNLATAAIEEGDEDATYSLANATSPNGDDVAATYATASQGGFKRSVSRTLPLYALAETGEIDFGHMDEAEEILNLAISSFEIGGETDNTVTHASPTKSPVKRKSLHRSLSRRGSTSSIAPAYSEPSTMATPDHVVASEAWTDSRANKPPGAPC
jgi:hypothetical protein